jgi:hypothetical protein
MDRKMVSMSYLVDQSPSAAVRLKHIRHYFISGVFELFICGTIVMLSMSIVSRFVSPSPS